MKVPAGKAPARPPRTKLARRSARLSTPVLIALFALVAASLRIYVMGPSFFYGDDYPLFSGLALDNGAIWNYQGHAMPLPVLTLAGLGATVGMQWWVAVTVVVVLQVIATAAIGALLARLTNTRWIFILAMVAITFSPMMIPSAVWLSAAVNALPFQAAAAGFTWAVIRQISRPEALNSVIALAAALFGVLCYERAILVPVFAVVVLYCGWELRPGRHLSGRTVGRLFARAAPLVLVTAPVWILWAALQLASGRQRYRQPPRTAEESASLADMMRTALTDGVALGPLGGPFNWVRVEQSTLWADSSLSLQKVGTLVLALALLWAARTLRWRARALLAVGGYALASLAPVYLARSNTSATILYALSFRHIGDVLLLLAATTVLAAGAASASPARASREPAHVSGASAHTTGAKRRGWSSAGPAPIAAAIGALFIGLTLVGHTTYRDVWKLNQGREYFANFRASMADAPPELIAQTFNPGPIAGLPRQPDLLRRTIDPGAPWLRPALIDPPALHFVTATGEIVPAHLTPARTATLPSPVCLDSLHPVARIALDPLIAWDWYVSVRVNAPGDAARIYLAQDGPLTVGDRTPVELPGGEHTAVALVPGQGTGITVSLGSSGGRGGPVCVSALTVGTLDVDS